VPELCHPVSERLYPDVGMEHLVLCFSLYLVLVLGVTEVSLALFFTLPLNVPAHIDKIPPELPLLEAEHSQLSQSLLTSEVLQSLDIFLALNP